MKKKKNETIFRIYTILSIISVCAFFGCLINGLVRKELNNDERPIWFIITIIAFIFMIISWTVLIRYLLNEQNKKNSERRRVQNYQQNKDKNKVASNILDGNDDIEFSIRTQLYELQKERIDMGELYYKQKQYRKSVEIDAFCVVNDGIKNSCDFDTEQDTINGYSNEIIEYFNSKDINCDFLNCAFVFLTDNLDEKQIEFYNNFIGLWNCEMDNNKFTKNQFFNYCCIDKNTRQIAYFVPSKHDDGDEADLSYMISENLQIKVSKTEIS